MRIKTKVLIIGAGVGGLGAGSWLTKYGQEDFLIFDGSKEVPKNLHNGVHYLHSVPELPFDFATKKVTLSDGVLAKGGSVDEAIIKGRPNLVDILAYSEKVREIQHPSSIMEIGKRPHVFLPESNSLNELISEMENYIGEDKFKLEHWLSDLLPENKIATFKKGNEEIEVQYEHCINTAPLDFVLPMFGMHRKFEAFPVHITNFKVDKIVPNWMINLYVANTDSPVYRASLLNNVCSIESIHPLDEDERAKAIMLLEMFHLRIGSHESYTWKTGKVKSISIDERDEIVDVFHKQSFYSIGRFGLWNRKLLVDSTIEQARQVVLLLAEAKQWEEVKKKLV